jgi:hypothetical protein
MSNLFAADANKRGDDEVARKAAVADAEQQQTSANEHVVSTPRTVNTTPAASREVPASSLVCCCYDIYVLLLAESLPSVTAFFKPSVSATIARNTQFTSLTLLAGASIYHIGGQCRNGNT